MPTIIPAEIVESRIFLIRGQKVMLDMHLAELYGVTTKVLNQAVKRNRDRLPGDFMFQLTESEDKAMRSQIVTASEPNQRAGSRSQSVTLKQKRNITHRPYAFTEQGVAMLSSVLRSKRAVRVNILVMRTFVKIRELMATHIELARKIEELELKYGSHDQAILIITEIMKKMTERAPEPQEPDEPEEEKPPIGFYMPKK